MCLYVATPYIVNFFYTSTGGGLALRLDIEDVTRHSVRDTQRAVKEAMGVNSRILARMIFRDWHFFGRLLEASDMLLKEDLSLVVPWRF